MPHLVIRLLLFVIRSRSSPEMIVLGLCALLLLAVAGPAMLQMRERARSHATQDRFQQLGRGLQSYHEAFQHFPSGTVINSNSPDAKPNEPSQLISPLMILAPAGG